MGEEYIGGGKWRNGFAHGDCIYGIPFSENQFLKYNTKTGTSELVGDDFGVDDWKWMSGAVTDYDKWLKIDIATETTSLVGDDLSKYGACKYSCGVVGEDCNVYAIPYDENKVAKLNTTTQEKYQRLEIVITGEESGVEAPFTRMVMIRFDFQYFIIVACKLQ